MIAATLSTAAPPSAGRLDLSGYQLRLPGFEGPLDVLLRLVERERLPIAEVSLVAVTDQYLAHLADLEDTGADLAAGFAAVAGRLLVLKSRSLLPRPPAPTEDAEPDDLVRQLADYRAIRDAARSLACHQDTGRSAFPVGGAVASPAAGPPRLAPQPPFALAKALRRRLAAHPLAPQPVPLTPVLTLQACAARFVGILRRANSAPLRALLATANREHLIVGFLAVLVLLRRRVAEASQPEPFGEILVTLNHPEAANLDGLDGLAS